MVEFNDMIWTVWCPHCEIQTGVSVKMKHKLNEMRVECNKCDWKDYASNGLIKEMKFEDWLSFEDGRDQSKVQVSTEFLNRADLREWKKNFEAKTKDKDAE